MSNEEILEKHYKHYSKRIAFLDNVLSAMDEARADERQRIIREAGLPDDEKEMADWYHKRYKDNGCGAFIDGMKRMRVIAAAVIAKEREDNDLFLIWAYAKEWRFSILTRVGYSIKKPWHNRLNSHYEGISTAQLRELYEKSK